MIELLTWAIETHKELRNVLFGSFLSAGSLSVAALAFMATRLGDYYNSAGYLADMIEVEREVAPDAKVYLSAVPEMIWLTRVTSWACLLAAFCQVTVGLIPGGVPKLICLIAAASGGGLLMYTIDRTMRLYGDVARESQAAFKRKVAKEVGMRRVG